MTDDVALDKHLSLQIEAPKDDLAWGDEALVRLTASNTGASTIEAVSLNLHSQPGVTWSEDFKGLWLELGDLAAGESRVIEGRVNVDGLPASGSLPLFATLHGHGVESAEAKAELLVPGVPLEESDMAAGGGAVDAAGGRVRFTFPANWNESDARLTFHLQEQYRQAAGETGRLLLFTVEAAASDDLVEAFDAAATVEIALGDLIDPAWAAENRPVVSTRQSEKENWTAVESTFDPKTGLLQFKTTHFSSYQVTTEPQLWRLLYNPPGASPYTGAATYHFPIALPPGISGLTPGLTLAYSSRPVDSMKAPVMSHGFGAGWSFPQAQITNGNSGPMYNTNGCCNYDKSAFTLNLNGVTYYLNPLIPTGRHGTFRAIGGPELLIEFIQDGAGANDTNNVSGEFWRVRTPDGTTYTFGRMMDSEQVVYPVSTIHNAGQPRNKAFSAYNWKLDRIEDVHGNRIEYVYGHSKCGLDSDNNVRKAPLGPEHNYADQCTEVDTAVSEIRYNFVNNSPQTTVAFTYEEVNGEALHIVQSMTAGIYRPTQIDVKHNNNVTSRYTFAYHPVGFHYITDWVGSAQFWMLKSITQSGAGGSGTLPAQTFDYDLIPFNGCASGDNQGETNYCVRALKRVSNGYGAVTEFNYAKIDNKWMHVTAADMWDGVAHKHGLHRPQTRLLYDRSGQGACYDASGSVCHMGTAPPSDALVGFDGVTIWTQAPSGASAWTNLAKQVTTFHNDNYWLLGKEKTRSNQTPGSVEVSHDAYQWVAPNGDDQLQSETHTIRDGAVTLSRTTVYAYDNTAYGALVKKEEYDEANSLFRCTEYVYAHRTSDAWLVNRPIRETIKVTMSAGICSGAKLAETLYRYAESSNPTIIGLDARARLTYILTWDGTNYVTEKRTYTAQGLPQTITTYDSPSTTTAYATDTRNTTTSSYNTLGMPTQIGRGGADVTTENQWLTYDTTFPWLVASVKDSNQITTQYGYDVFGRLSKVAMPGDTLTSPTMSHAYSDGAAPWKIETSYKNAIRSTERNYYDGLGRLAQAQIDDANVEGVGARDIITTIGYDARGLEVCRAVPYPVAATANAFQIAACSSITRTTTTYDALGRVTGVTTPDNVTSDTTYGVATNITVTGHSKFLRTSSYDGNDHAVNRFSDVFGRLVLVREFTGNSTYTAYADTRYSYDAMGNLTAVGTSAASDSPPGAFLRLTTMTYDKLGRKTGMTDPDMGVWSYKYDPAGNLLWQKDSQSQAICFYYDDFNRPIQRQIDDNAGDSNCPALMNRLNLPDTAPGHLASYVYGSSDPSNNIGRPVEVKWGPNPNANRDTLTYDGEGRLAAQTRLVSGQSFLYQVTAYDLLDRPTSVTLPGGEVVVTTYDKEGANKLTAGGTTLINSVGYNERGQLAYLERANGAPATTLSYHGAAPGNFRLNKIVHGAEGSDALPDFISGAQNYDAVGNLTGMQMKVNTGTATTDTYSFYYDEMNRLTTATLDGPDPVDYLYTYAYDRLGNIASRTGTDPDMTYSYGAGPAGPQAVTGVDLNVGDDLTFTYDLRGNMATKAKSGIVSHIYTFDTENRLASVRTGNQTMSFAYDADGQRVMTTRHDGTIIYTPFPDYEVEDPPTGANTVRTTYRFAGQIVALQTKVGTAAGTFYYTYTDHLGNVAALSSKTGAFTAGSLARYDPFGNYRTTPSTAVNPAITNHGFTGHRHNNTGIYPTQNVGLIYMNARYYLPEVGRFISADTIVPEAENPQSFNRYSYTLNNPLNFTDPSGYCALDSDGNIIKTDCTVEDFQTLSWEQRLAWLDAFVRQYGLGDWFDDIRGAIGILSSDVNYSNMEGWAAYMDAAVLQAINDGMQMSLGHEGIGSAISDRHTFSLINGGQGWKDFFLAYRDNMDASDLNQLIVLRLAAEQGGVDYAGRLSGSKERYKDEALQVEMKIDLFLFGTNSYRSFGRWCRGNYSCESSYTDPRVATETALFRFLGRLPGPISWFLYGAMNNGGLSE